MHDECARLEARHVDALHGLPGTDGREEEAQVAAVEAIQHVQDIMGSMIRCDCTCVIHVSRLSIQIISHQ